MSERLRGKDIPTSDRLYKSLKHAALLYAGDADLVRPGADRHGIRVTEGDMFTPLVAGCYNARLPKGGTVEVEQLKRVRSLTFMCEDYRQSDEVVETLRLDVFSGWDAIFASAGGGAQPDKTRRDAAIELAVATFSLNSDMTINLVVHTGVCGGVNFHTNGEARFRNKSSTKKELKFMLEFERQMQQGMIAGGVSEEQIRLYLSHVNEANSFSGLSRL